MYCNYERNFIYLYPPFRTVMSVSLESIKKLSSPNYFLLSRPKSVEVLQNERCLSFHSAMFLCLSSIVYNTVCRIVLSRLLPYRNVP